MLLGEIMAFFLHTLLWWYQKIPGFGDCGYCRTSFIPTQHLCHHFFPTHPVSVLQQFLTVCSISTPSFFRWPHILPSVPPCTDVCLLSRTKRCCPKRPRCLFHDAGIWLSLFAYSSLSRSHFWTFPQWWSRIHTIFWVCFIFLSSVFFPKA